MSDKDETAPVSGNRWENAERDTPGAVATADPAERPAHAEHAAPPPAGGHEPVTPAPGGRSRRGWLVPLGTGLAGLVIGGGVGFGLGHATSGEDGRPGFGPGQGPGQGPGRFDHHRGFGRDDDGNGPGGFGPPQNQPNQQNNQQNNQQPNQQDDQRS